MSVATESEQLYPIKFLPHYKEVLWGGTKISEYKGVDLHDSNVGESWEISAVPGSESVVAAGPDAGLTITQVIKKYGSRLVGKTVYEEFGTTFPLLVKIIDANKDLSFQVHPDNELARARHNCFGKTEMWYIIDCRPDARLYAGLNQDTTPEDYKRRIEDGSIMDIVTCHKTVPGDIYFLPPGCTHSIGAGNLLAEIQQTSDITYRVYDYKRRDANGNYRQLHTDLAREAVDYRAFDSKMDYEKNGKCSKLVDCDFFRTSLLKVEGHQSYHNERDSFLIVMCIEGDAQIGSTTLRRGETLLVPAEMKDVDIQGTATLLLATV